MFDLTVNDVDGGQESDFLFSFSFIHYLKYVAVKIKKYIYLQENCSNLFYYQVNTPRPVASTMSSISMSSSGSSRQLKRIETAACGRANIY